MILYSCIVQDNVSISSGTQALIKFICFMTCSTSFSLMLIWLNVAFDWMKMLCWVSPLPANIHRVLERDVSYFFSKIFSCYSWYLKNIILAAWGYTFSVFEKWFSLLLRNKILIRTPSSGISNWNHHWWTKFSNFAVKSLMFPDEFVFFQPRLLSTYTNSFALSTRKQQRRLHHVIPQIKYLLRSS